MNDRAIAEDYLITKNTVIDPVGTGFAVHIDPPQSKHSVFRRIRIVENRIIRRVTVGPAITVGTVDNSVVSRGNVFVDITLEGNVIELSRVVSDSRQQEAVIRLNTSARAALIFNRVMIKDNTIAGNGAGSGWGLDLRSLQNSVVEGNTVNEVRFGIAIVDALNSFMRGNTVKASDVAYHFSSSRGRNTIRDNRVVGNPITRWEFVKIHPSDVVDRK